MSERLEWLKWRQKGIGSSDAPIIMMVSPWATPLDLYEDKTAEEIVEKEENFIQARGNKMEPKIRALLELKNFKSYKPALCEDHVEGVPMPFLASLDGRSEDFTEIIEIKLLGKEDYENAKAGKPPEKYIPQMQHQLMVEKRAKFCTFVGYPYEADFNGNMDVSKLVTVRVERDPEYIATLMQEEIKFMDHVVKRKPPVPSAKDYKTLRAKGMTAKIRKWKKLQAKADAIAEEAKAVRAEIEAACKADGHPRFVLGGVRMRLESRAGSMSYAKIPAVKKLVDAMDPKERAKYQGAGSSFWKFEIEDEVEGE